MGKKDFFLITFGVKCKFKACINFIQNKARATTPKILEQQNQIQRVQEGAAALEA